MFAKESEGNATDELFSALQHSSTDRKQHSTRHFVTMSNGDVWMFQFSPDNENAWYISDITLLSKEQADLLSLF